MPAIEATFEYMACFQDILSNVDQKVQQIIHHIHSSSGSGKGFFKNDSIGYESQLPYHNLRFVTIYSHKKFIANTDDLTSVSQHSK